MPCRQVTVQGPEVQVRDADVGTIQTSTGTNEVSANATISNPNGFGVLVTVRHRLTNSDTGQEIASEQETLSLSAGGSSSVSRTYGTNLQSGESINANVCIDVLSTEQN